MAQDSADLFVFCRTHKTLMVVKDWLVFVFVFELYIFLCFSTTTLCLSPDCDPAFLKHYLETVGHILLTVCKLWVDPDIYFFRHKRDMWSVGYCPGEVFRVTEACYCCRPSAVSFPGDFCTRFNPQIQDPRRCGHWPMAWQGQRKIFLYM